ncbi:helix-turn-helix domain containing protein [Enterocloster clostridioformis]|uniref:helix-turn-helix domain-containing protein n=1 Tax=Enterocloster clostridioformis TaxID=1531 RepID=UPI00080CA304|nr:helix-turn-helix domain-containing protein [Enterocloster clostridioformis]ANU50723.1 helix-turn-helix domain containing protein [Lachnoclostridium sp. YL32]NDO28705.1 helix-turn-helix domain-containing protein [Enterocloster clostridioformis]OXE71447.1 helix-turn-helix domain containing protein [Enterocloster clostridioformis]QQR01282.1 helix-turn-helix domain-containing protein [Enterocloster clostridioformis]
MRDSYNPEGYHCLIIAILMGVNAREARFLYEHGLNNPISQKILKKKHPKIVRVSTRKERKEVIQQLRSEGYSIEAIADILNCDYSTVKRNSKLKRRFTS